MAHMEQPRAAEMLTPMPMSAAGATIADERARRVVVTRRWSADSCWRDLQFVPRRCPGRPSPTVCAPAPGRRRGVREPKCSAEASGSHAALCVLCCGSGTAGHSLRTTQSRFSLVGEPIPYAPEWRRALDGRTNSTAAVLKKISFSGVQLVVPSAWPVIDGAHARNPCSSTFEGQADRTFLGVTHQGAPSCAAPSPRATPPPADRVWMQPGGRNPPSKTATVLPSGQAIYLSTNKRAAAVTVWYHRVLIQIGIGPNPAVEGAILDSIEFSPAIPDTAVLGRCPRQSQARRPCPTRPASRRRWLSTTAMPKCNPSHRTFNPESAPHPFGPVSFTTSAPAASPGHSSGASSSAATQHERQQPLTPTGRRPRTSGACRRG